MLDRPFLQSRLIDAIPVRLERIDRSVHLARPDIVAEYEQVRPLIVAGAVASWFGMWYELLRPTPGKLDILLGHPVLNLLVARGDELRDLTLAQIDHVTGRATLRAISRELPVPHGERMVPLAELVGVGRDSTQALAEARAAAGEALNVDGLECIVLSGGAMPWRNADTSAGGRVPGAIRDTIAIARGIGTHAIQSTLPAWSTIRALRRLQALREA